MLNAVIQHQPILRLPELLTTIQAAQMLGLKKGTLDRWRQTGLSTLRFVKVGRNVRYTKSEVLAYLDARTFTHTGETCFH